MVRRSREPHATKEDLHGVWRILVPVEMLPPVNNSWAALRCLMPMVKLPLAPPEE
jgi:hypothetical protein